MRRSNLPLLLAVLVEAMGYGAIFGLLADLQDRYGFAQWGLGVIAASAFPAALLGQLGLSRYADRGHTRWLLWIGLGTAAAGMIWFWLGSELWEFVLARILVGIGSGTFIPAARRVFISRSPDNPGRAISMAGAADIGGFLVGIPVAKGLEQLFGAGTTPDPNTPFLVLALVLLAVGPIAAMTPEPPVHDRHTTGAEIRKVFRLPLARAGLSIGLGFAVIIGTFDAVAARFLKDLGGTNGELIIVMVALFVPLVAFMPVAGRLVDRIGAVRAGSTALLACAPLVLAFGLTRELFWIGVAGFGVALLYSVVYTSGQSAVACATTCRGLTGAGQGAYEACYATGAMVCSLVAPLLYRRDDAVWMWLVTALLSVGFGLAARYTAHHEDVVPDELDPEAEELLHQARAIIPVIEPH